MGPLAGIRIVELAGIGPGPFCAMMLADMGATVIRVDRIGGAAVQLVPPHADPLQRGRPRVGIDLKRPEGVAAVLRLVEGADGLVEGFRPGVMERLGLGPEECSARNPRLVYGRITGWGQDGPLAGAAGHDINYIALAGALDPIGRAGEGPVLPLNLVGDFGGGGMLLAFGLVAGMLEARRSGRGQVVDAAMTDGAALLTAMFHGMLQQGAWRAERGTNLLDGGAPFYDVYETSDGQYVSLGAIEPQFYEELLSRCGLEAEDLPDQFDESSWPEVKTRFGALVKTRTRREWQDLLEGTDACFAPVLSLAEAPEHPHNRARSTFIDVGGVVQPAPAPRFSRTPVGVPAPAASRPEDGPTALSDWGFGEDEVQELLGAGVVG